MFVPKSALPLAVPPSWTRASLPEGLRVNDM